MLERFRKKWGIESNFKVILILIIFAITGSSAVFVKDLIFGLIGIDEQTPFLLKVLFYILTILPSYQILLNFYAAIFGQFKFFWGFQKKTFQRITFRRSRVNN